MPIVLMLIVAFCKFWEDEWRPYVFLVHVCVFRVVLYDRSDADAYISYDIVS